MALPDLFSPIKKQRGGCLCVFFFPSYLKITSAKVVTVSYLTVALMKHPLNHAATRNR